MRGFDYRAAEAKLMEWDATGGFDVFLSYARSDGAAATELNGWLRKQGLRTFFDRSELRPGLRPIMMRWPSSVISPCVPPFGVAVRIVSAKPKARVSQSRAAGTSR